MPGRGPDFFVVYNVVLELVVDACANDALVHTADDGVAILKVHTNVFGELVFNTEAHVEPNVVIFVRAYFYAGAIDNLGVPAILHHRVVDADEGVDVEFLVPHVQQVVGIDVHIPARVVLVLKEVVETHLGAQLVMGEDDLSWKYYDKFLATLNKDK